MNKFNTQKKKKIQGHSKWPKLMTTFFFFFHYLWLNLRPNRKQFKDITSDRNLWLIWLNSRPNKTIRGHTKWPKLIYFLFLFLIYDSFKTQKKTIQWHNKWPKLMTNSFLFFSIHNLWLNWRPKRTYRVAQSGLIQMTTKILIWYRVFF